MIGRTWRGWTRAEDADAYADYVAETGLAAYRSTAGNRGAWVLTRTDGDRAEVRMPPPRLGEHTDEILAELE